MLSKYIDLVLSSEPLKKKKVVYFGWLGFSCLRFCLGRGFWGGYCWIFYWFFTLFAYKSVHIWFTSE